MRMTSIILAISGSVGLVAACAHAQSETVAGSDAKAPSPCALSLMQTDTGRALIAEAAPGLVGRWSLQAGGPAMMMEQSGDLEDRPADQWRLARLDLASPSGPAPELDTLRPGQTVISGSPDTPVFASLQIEDEAGRLICTAELG
ncbi:hypothetical protein ACFELO_04875 [Oceanicaulis sp. LC35]|uniref:hypothetical protein n=1 Tax=Oceanicaulis sp. LC35 TaxID=3349635 RepID=UPI003F855C4C